MRTIYIDETGYTGEDMLAADQPIFVVAAHDIPEEQCRQLINTHCARTQAPELKHVGLRRTVSGRRQVLALLEAVRETGASRHLYPVHKEFSLVVRYFDLLIEPQMHRDGVDAYGDAANVSLTNRWYFALKSILGAEDFRLCLAAFQALVRERTEASLSNLQTIVGEVCGRYPNPEFSEVLTLLTIGANTMLADVRSYPDNALDLSLTVLLDVIGRWRKQEAGPFKLIHDASTNMAKQQATWDWLTSSDQQEALLGFDDYRSLPLPLNVVETTFKRSEAYTALQVADVMAGAHAEVVRRLYGLPCNEAYADELLKIGMDECSNNILPIPDWKPPIADEEAGEMVSPFDALSGLPLRPSP